MTNTRATVSCRFSSYFRTTCLLFAEAMLPMLLNSYSLMSHILSLGRIICLAFPNPTLNSQSWWMGVVGMCRLWWERILSRTCPGILLKKGGCEVEIGVLDFNLSPQCRPGNRLHYFILSLSLGDYSIQIQTHWHSTRLKYTTCFQESRVHDQTCR